MNETHQTSLTPFRRSFRLTALVLPVPVLPLVLAFALTRSPASIAIAALFVVAGIVYVSATYISQVLARRQSQSRSAEVPAKQRAHGQRVAYVRVSSAGQNLARQLEAVGECDQIFTERQSGKSATDRPQLQALIRHVRRGYTSDCALVQLA